MIITGTMTFLTSILLWCVRVMNEINLETQRTLAYFGYIDFFLPSFLFRFYFPDSPINARFFTTEEKRLAVLRMKVNETGVENKHFKLDQ